MKCLDPSAIDAAERFVWLSGRLLDRHRFAHLFRGAPAEPVIAALRPYQNADGGFGNALEPDLRCPISQPQPVEVALRLLDELDAFDDPMVRSACDYLTTITTRDGGVPFVLASASEYPCAPWWMAAGETPASLNPTAALAGLLHRHGTRHPWLERATAFCWDRLDRMERTEWYEARTVLLFLEHAPDRARAEAMTRRVVAMMVAQGLVALAPGAGGEAHSPLEVAVTPGSLARHLFADDVLDAHLDATIAGQEEDGGWNIDFPIWTPATGLEWRSIVTIDVLQLLRGYGRWPS